MIKTVPPVAVRLMAIAARISSVFRFRIKNARIIPIKPPITIVIRSPSHALWVRDEKITPNNAENNIMPSSAMLQIPDLAAIADASVANRIGVADLKIVEKKSGDKIAFHILMPPPHLSVLPLPLWQ